jgi:hypothetical protein
MNREKNRTFYFIDTVDEEGNEIVKVGSDFAPMWGKSFKSLTEAVEAVKRRNSQATSFNDIRNGLVAVYSDNKNANDGDTL